jgi:hypothetical protein
MYAHARGLRATITTLGMSILLSSATPGQNARLVTRLPESLSRSNALPVRLSCAEDLPTAPAFSKLGAFAANGLSANCDAPAPATTINTDPCLSNGIGTAGCVRFTAPDSVSPVLEGLGKEGRKIFRARERVLEILETENACSAWYRQKDSNPGATFRTIGFEVDRNGEDTVLESRDGGPVVLFRNPYVASVIQGDGGNATITLNLRGAFFEVMAKVRGVHGEGGPFEFRGHRMVKVGPYIGDTLQAQVVTLLHEFGHALDLLPPDTDDVDGKSVQNTERVIRHCRTEVEGKARPKLLAASH